MARSSRSLEPGRVARHGVLILASLGALFPLYVMVANSFKTNAGYLDSPLSPPTSISTQAIRDAFGGGDFPRWILNCAVRGGVLAWRSRRCSRSWRRSRSPDALAAARVVENALIALMVIPPIVMVDSALPALGRPQAGLHLPGGGDLIYTG